MSVQYTSYALERTFENIVVQLYVDTKRRTAHVLVSRDGFLVKKNWTNPDWNKVHTPGEGYFWIKALDMKALRDSLLPDDPLQEKVPEADLYAPHLTEHTVP